MARRRKARSNTGSKARRRWSLPRFRFTLRWLAVALAALKSRLHAEALRRMGIGLAWMIALAALAAGWIVGVPQLQAFASQARYAHEVHVRFVDAPRWFNGDLARHLTETAEMNLGGDPMRRDDLVICREALMQTGWFEEIQQVQRLGADLVEIEARFVHPYTVIRDAEGDHLVDIVGRLLPLKYPRGAKPDFIAIRGVHFGRPRIGEVWEGSDVAAALRLLQLIDNQPWRAQVAEIDMSGYVRGEPIRLRTDRHSSIVWGGAPGEEPALELLAPGKLLRLERIYSEYGHIDMGETGREVDLTDPRVVSSRQQGPG